MPRRSFQLPKAEQDNPGWGAFSVAVHAVIVLVLAATFGRNVVSRTIIRIIELAPPASTGRQVDVPVVSGSGSLAAAVAPEPPSTAAPVSRTPRVVTMPTYVPIAIPPPQLADHDPVLGSGARIGPRYGDGRLWPGQLEGRLGVVGPSPDPRTHYARVDSAIRTRIKTAIDALPPDSFNMMPDAPSWTTEIDGNKWGVDQQWIYLGDLKLPSALLALLPIPQTGNYYLAKENQELLRIRGEIIQQAAQMETNADIRNYIQEIRKRRDKERDDQKKREAALAAAREAVKKAKKDTIP